MGTGEKSTLLKNLRIRAVCVVPIIVLLHSLSGSSGNQTDHRGQLSALTSSPSGSRMAAHIPVIYLTRADRNSLRAWYTDTDLANMSVASRKKRGSETVCIHVERATLCTSTLLPAFIILSKKIGMSRTCHRTSLGHIILVMLCRQGQTSEGQLAHRRPR